MPGIGAVQGGQSELFLGYMPLTLACICARACVLVKMKGFTKAPTSCRWSSLLSLHYPYSCCVNDTELRSPTRMQEHFESLSTTAENLDKICGPWSPVPNVKKDTWLKDLRVATGYSCIIQEVISSKEKTYVHIKHLTLTELLHDRFNIPMLIDYRSHNLQPFRSVNHGVYIWYHIYYQSNLPPLDSPSTINFNLLNVWLWVN